MSSVFAFIGSGEIVVILAIALLVFGPTKLPEIGRQIALALREMRRMSNEVQSALDLNAYDARYDGGSSYDGSYSASFGSPADERENANNGEPPTNTRPWSVDDEEPARFEGERTVIGVEPPGPPVLRERRQSSETNQA